MTEGLVIVHDAAAARWLRFEAPCRIVQAFRADEVEPALREAASLVKRRGWHAAGFLAYEAAGAFDPALCVKETPGFPLLWFGLYPEARSMRLPEPDYGAYELGAPVASVGRAGYDAAIGRIRHYIQSGDTYQVNYTLRLLASFRGDAVHLFLAMVRAQSPGYAAYVDAGRYALCSASPELFFHLDGGTLTCKPMKGTVHRGRTLEEDKSLAAWLQHSEKNRAENLMIVDMIRNDLGRVAEFGGVRVEALFEVERHPTLWQMTSTILARCAREPADIFAALFPCASITGAPKIRTSRIIAELEPDPRRAYTGCIGFLAPDGRAQFNVAIRTAVVDRSAGTAEYGAGGGIVWDSASPEEYTEAILKARVLTERPPAFSLLETLRWTPEESYFLLEHHLRRLADSAEYFRFRLDVEAVRRGLLGEAAGFGSGARRVRLILSADGTVSVDSAPLGEEAPARIPRVAIAHNPVQSGDVFLYHKTTHREVYERALRDFPDCDDVLLWNEKGELTESCVANAVVDIGGELVTPPVDCGLLAGAMRAQLLEEGRIRERVVRVADLGPGSRICLVNSVRLWREARLHHY